VVGGNAASRVCGGPGAAVRVSFEDRGGRKFINRLEVLK